MQTPQRERKGGPLRRSATGKGIGEGIEGRGWSLHRPGNPWEGRRIRNGGTCATLWKMTSVHTNTYRHAHTITEKKVKGREKSKWDKEADTDLLTSVSFHSRLAWRSQPLPRGIGFASPARAGSFVVRKGHQGASIIHGTVPRCRPVGERENEEEHGDLEVAVLEDEANHAGVSVFTENGRAEDMHTAPTSANPPSTCKRAQKAANLQICKPSSCLGNLSAHHANSIFSAQQRRHPDIPARYQERSCILSITWPSGLVGSKQQAASSKQQGPDTTCTHKQATPRQKYHPSPPPSSHYPPAPINQDDRPVNNASLSINPITPVALVQGACPALGVEQADGHMTSPHSNAVRTAGTSHAKQSRICRRACGRSTKIAL
ncbi:hypothetical protein B0J11DRAFT_604840 [Dendryphion nanum]|uniref:Uncharacterized protein n=1 Tax=Dendryphion nanum TaxID=256645 RepID=A0A9P9DXN1_9PLEO|nr:hypothetical protein B0J11DRAFT_604840 [Dendryphion nanum]